MPKRRPVTRLFLALPPQGDGGPARPHASIDQLAGLIAEELFAHGVQVTRHVWGSAPEGGARADVTLWLPDEEGRVPTPDLRELPARVHVALATGPLSERAALSRYDAVLVPHETLVEPVKRAADALGGGLEVIAVRLPARAPVAREAEKAARKVGSQPVVLVDAREGFDAEIDRVVFQLALMSAPATRVLLAPHTEAARSRVRTLCERHAVDAYLASGPDAFAAAVPAVDLVVGRPSWVELLLLAVHQGALAWLGGESGSYAPLVRGLRSAGAIDEVTGVLQLAAAIDRRLSDPGGVRAKGVQLHAHLVGEARAFLEVLGELSPRSQVPRGTGTWEPVGPHATLGRPKEQGVVEARAEGEAEDDRAQRIEDALSQLKARIQSEGDGSP